ncbi:MAG: hypothetical protein PHP86_09265 [Nevskiales bacterium]|nr:hypothetical protein [Nevskiales bacterium]
MSHDPEITAASARLLQAGRRLAGRSGAAHFDRTDICDEAGLPPETVDAAFGDYARFECALLGALLDDVRDTVARVTTNMAPGIPRLKLSIETYLESSLMQPAISAMARRHRNSRSGEAVLRARIAGFTLMMELELCAIGWPHPSETAQLFTQVVLDIAAAEAEARRRQLGLREVLFGYFRSGP